jgi:hypothetical protein
MLSSINRRCKDSTFAQEDFNYDSAGGLYIYPGRKNAAHIGTPVHEVESLLLSSEQG